MFQLEWFSGFKNEIIRFNCSRRRNDVLTLARRRVEFLSLGNCSVPTPNLVFNHIHFIWLSLNYDTQHSALSRSVWKYQRHRRPYWKMFWRHLWCSKWLTLVARSDSTNIRALCRSISCHCDAHIINILLLVLLNLS